MWPHICFLIITLITNIQVLFTASNVTLDKYKKQTATKCEDGFVEGINSVKFKSKIHLINTRQRPIEIVVYEIKGKDMTSFRPICTIMNMSDNTYGYCRTESIGDYVQVHIVISDYFSNYSEALLRGRLKLTDGSIGESEIQELPKLYVRKQSAVEITIDGQRMSVSDTTMPVTNTSINILFQCTETTPSPCLLEIVNSQNNQTVAKGAGLISICCNLQNDLTLTFTYNFCYSSDQKNTFTYSFQTEVQHGMYIDLGTTTGICFGTLIIGVLIGLLVMAFAYNSFKKSRVGTYLRGVMEALRFGREITVDKDATYGDIMASLQYEDYSCQETSNEGVSIRISCPKEDKHNYFMGLKDVLEKSVMKDENVGKLVKSVFHLTVKLDVNNISNSREKFWPGTGVRYPLSSSETPTAKNRSGTGRVWKVIMYKNGIDSFGGRHKKYTSCPCAQCKQSGKPNSKFAKISISTSKALVYNDFEAAGVICLLFYDSSFQMDSHNKRLDGFYVEQDKITTDFCSLACYTCNIPLFERLKKYLNRFNQANEAIQSQKTAIKRLNSFVFIVSHPHGEYKKISYGKIVRKYEIRGPGTSLVYTAPTCPGSSGAPVIAPAHSSSWSNETQIIHFGQVDSKHSCSGFFSASDTS
ncbi:hypothetical protein BgiMline_031794 [Biomphalaria glabrata]